MNASPPLETPFFRVNSNAIGQVQERLEPRTFRVPELLDIHPGVCSADHGTQRNRNDRKSMMVFRPFHSRVFQARKMVLEGDPFHLLLPLFCDTLTSL